MSEDKKGEKEGEKDKEKDKEKKEETESLENIRDIKNSDEELQEELKEWEVESTEAGD